MKSCKKTALGIDIRGRQVSLALVEKDEHGFRTIAAAGSALPTGELGRGGAAESRVLSGLFAQLGRRIRGTQAAVALSADSIVMQLLDMPKQVPTNIGEFVKNELQQYVALSGKTVVSDFCGVGSAVERRLLAVAADANEVREIVNACSATGIVVDAVEPSMLAYTRALLERQKDARRNGDRTIAMLVPRKLTVCFFHRGTLDFVRVRNLPAEANTLRLLCTWLAEELKAVARYRDTEVSPAGRDRQVCVAIHDGVHTAGEIAPLLAAETGTGSFTVVDACEPWTGVESAKDDPPPQEVSMAAVGAALTLLGTGPDGLKINLLPKAVAEARSLSRHLLLTANIGVLIFLGVFVTAQLLSRTTRAMDRRIGETRLSEQFYAAPALIAEDRFLDREISRLRQHLEPLRKVIGGEHRADWPSILNTVRQAIPADVSITQLQSGDGRTLSLKGTTSSCPAAETFVRNLDGQEPFESISLARVQRPQNNSDRLEYQIDCVLKAKGGKPS
jgi:Tfp pilus assembly protein PilN